MNSVARMVLNDFQRGRLPYFVKPPAVSDNEVGGVTTMSFCARHAMYGILVARYTCTLILMYPIASKRSLPCLELDKCINITQTLN